MKEFVETQKAFYAKYQENFGPELENFNVDDDQDDNETVAEVAPAAVQAASESMQQQREAEKKLPPPERTASHLSYRIEQHQNIWSNNQIHDGLATCTKAQFDFIINFVNKVKRKYQNNEDDGKVWFLSGGAGVGKTRTTHLLCEILKKYFNRMPGCDQGKMQVVKCAFCGKAAHQVGGHTIHTLFKMQFGDSKNDHLRSDKLAELQDMLSDLKVLIIDEISMVNNGIFGNIDKRLRAIKGKDNVPFGGVTVLVVGDLFQLPPINSRMLWMPSTIKFKQSEAKNQTVEMFISKSSTATNIWKDHVQMFELTEIMRQKEQKEWAQFLNRLRENPMSD